MEKILDKIIIFICCSIFLFNDSADVYTVVSVIIVISLISFNIAFDIPAVHISSYAAFLVMCYFLPELLHFIPLMCYDLFFEPFKHVSIAAIFPLYIHMEELRLIMAVWLCALLLLTYFLKMRTSALISTRHDWYLVRDELKEQSERLRNRNRELLERQDYEITNATLNERNRIAREIHDTVGHLLSSSILQIGALMAVTKDERQREALSQVKDTLSQGMNSIRSSIHNIHEDSMNLEAKLNELKDNFTFCEVKLNYKITTDFTMKEKYTFLYIVKEALSNVMKHSNATAVSIVFAELPGFYRIIIEDNGTLVKSQMGRQRGMGVSGMYDRINGLGGNINISCENGYRIFITLPKVSDKEGK